MLNRPFVQPKITQVQRNGATVLLLQLIRDEICDMSSFGNLCLSGLNYFMVTSRSSRYSGFMSQASAVSEPMTRVSRSGKPSVYGRAFSSTHQTHTSTFCLV